MKRLAIIIPTLAFACSLCRAESEVIALGSRLELFVDWHLIAEMQEVALKLNPLEPAERSCAPALDGHYASVLRVDNGYLQ